MKKPLVSKVSELLSRSRLGTPKREERLVNQTETVLGSVHEHGSGDATGRGKGSGSTPERIAPGQRVAIETLSQPRVESMVHPGNGVPVLGPGGSCERFYIGDGPTSHETNKRVKNIGML